MPIEELQISFEQRFDASIEEHIRDVKRIWPLNSKRFPLHIWMEVVGRATVVCEAVRKLEWDTVIDELATLVMWWFAFVGCVNDLDERSGDDVIFRIPSCAGDILWKKYPQVCPACVTTFVQDNPSCTAEQVMDSLGITCTCLSRKRFVEERSEKAKQLAKRLVKEISQLRYNNKPLTLVDFEKLFVTIYHPVIYALTPEEIAFHLLEEVGEVSNALVNATIHREFITTSRQVPFNLQKFLKEAREKATDIEAELADVFSWSVGLLEKAKQVLSSASRLCIKFNEGIASKEFLDGLFETLSIPTRKLNIIEIIWKKYEHNGKLGHKTCKSNVCKCNEEGQLLLQNHPLSDEVKKSLASMEL